MERNVIIKHDTELLDFTFHSFCYEFALHFVSL